MVLMGGVELPQRAVREQIVMAVGLIVQLQRTADGRRVISSITEVQGMEGDTVLLQDVFHRVGTAEGLGDLVPTGLRPKILDELLANGIQVPPTIFRNEAEPFLNSSRARNERPGRPARPGRVEPPSEELYEMLAQRRRDGR
jgi:pilus assembly protein CpaF